MIDVAIAHGVDILCEKPIADTMEASVRIARKVKAAGRKMAVTMSHRFDQDKTTLRPLVRSGRLGKVNTVSCRYFADMREHMAWGALFRHTMQDPLMIEGAVHHLDLVADLAGANCETLYASTWKPAWAEYAGDTDGMVMMTFENGVRGVYEGSSSAAVGLNDWYQRICPRRLRARHRDPEQSRDRGVHAAGSDAPAKPRGAGAEDPADHPAEMAEHLADRAVLPLARWRRPMETHVEANVQASALIFAAIESQRTGMPIDVQAFIRQHT